MSPRLPAGAGGGLPPWLTALRAGDRRVLARVCRVLEDGEQRAPLRRQLRAVAGNPWVIGVTGSPGAGKSSLVSALTAGLRRQQRRVAVLAVDPSSPFSGGALLGDRIRMQEHFADPEVFIRSLATRGALGGLSRSVGDLLLAVAAWRADVVLVETVGVGQDELDVMHWADTTVVVLAPGMGDDVQATKAGILEIADVFVVNKSDLPGADACVADLRAMLAIANPPAASGALVGHRLRLEQAETAPQGQWRPPVLQCVATRAEGVEALLQGLEAHRQWLTDSGSEQRRERRLRRSERQLIEALTEYVQTRGAPLLRQSIERLLDGSGEIETEVERLLSGLVAQREATSE